MKINVKKQFEFAVRYVIILWKNTRSKFILWQLIR